MTDVLFDSYALCGECWRVTPYDLWRGLDRDDETERLVPGKPFDEARFYVCPYCGYNHTDDDSDAGMWEGPLAAMLNERNNLPLEFEPQREG